MSKAKPTIAETAAEMAAHHFDSSKYLSLSPVSVEQKPKSGKVDAGKAEAHQTKAEAKS